MKKFALALESDGLETDVVTEAPAEEIMASQAGVEEAHEEVLGNLEEVEGLQTNLEAGAEGSDTLMATADLMEDKVEDGEGMAPEAIQQAEITVESIKVRLGYGGAKHGRMPALEGFKTPRTRVASTKVALESVKDTVRKIWTKIVEFIKTMWEKIKMMIAKLITNYDKLVKHAEMLKSKAAAVEGEKVSETLDKSMLAKFFTIDGHATGATAEAYLNHVKGFADISKKVGSFVAGNADLEKIAMMEPEAAKAEADKHFAELGAAFGGKTSDGGTVVGPLPGNQWMKIMSKDGNFELEFEDGKSPATTLQALDKAGIEKLLTEVITVAKGGQELKEISAITEKSMKVLTQHAEGILKSLAKNEKDENMAKGYKEASKVATKFTGALNKVNTKLPQLHFSTVKYALDYASASIANFKKPA